MSTRLAVVFTTRTGGLRAVGATFIIASAALMYSGYWSFPAWVDVQVNVT